MDIREYIPAVLSVSQDVMVTAIKFMQSLDKSVYALLRKDADERGITMQELIRAVVIPEWYRNCSSDGRNVGR